MPKLHMTDVVVARLKLNGTYYDEMTPAFGLRVGKNRPVHLAKRVLRRMSGPGQPFGSIQHGDVGRRSPRCHD